MTFSAPKVIFIGHFSDGQLESLGEGSAAGTQVQLQIAEELTNSAKLSFLKCWAMRSTPVWPRGSLVCHSKQNNQIRYFGFINIPILKNILFAIRLLIAGISSQPDIYIQYNSFFFENLTLLLLKKLNKNLRVVAIVQDVYTLHDASKKYRIPQRLRAALESASLRQLSNFDLVVPVSFSIVRDFDLPPQRALLFQGGLTKFTTPLLATATPDLKNRVAIFAGALEPHNGIDLLLNRWIEQNIPFVLHIYGRGTLEAHVRKRAAAASNVCFHGFQSEATIQEAQSRAYWNFCLRLSKGLNEEYFFPSKFFNACASPGLVIVNKFHGIPAPLLKHLIVVEHDLSDLKIKIMKTSQEIDHAQIHERREIVSTKYTWRSCIDSIANTLASH